ncbi:hypothetical protein BGZ63DRAFT_425117 [Mariannaea sp. PMI_226]|nr:hypothetical protein BGZ63DRAFT_425117 [Mariannaea sp. PMI_226]
MPFSQPAEEYHMKALASEPVIVHQRGFLDGRWGAKDKTFPVYAEPTTETILGKFSNCDLSDFQLAIESGREGSLYGLEEYQVIRAITTGNLDK